MPRKRRFLIFALAVVILVVVDRIAKACAEGGLRLGGAGIDLGPIALTLVHNRGAAFGMGQGAGTVFVAFALVVVAVIVAWLHFGSEHDAFEVACVSLVAAGGLGNMIDRLTTGYVVDFFRFTFIDFPVFNVADICVTCGVIGFVLWLLVTGFSSGKNRGESS